MVLRRLGVGNNITEGWGGNKSLAGCWKLSFQEKNLGKHGCLKFMINGFPASCVHVGVTVNTCMLFKRFRSPSQKEAWHSSNFTPCYLDTSLPLNSGFLNGTMLFPCNNNNKNYSQVQKRSVIFASQVVSGEWTSKKRKRACFSRVSFLICFLSSQNLICALLNQTILILYLEQCLLPSFL